MARWSTLVVALALFAAVSTAETQGKMMTNLVISKTFFVQRHSRRKRENRFFFSVLIASLGCWLRRAGEG